MLNEAGMSTRSRFEFRLNGGTGSESNVGSGQLGDVLLDQCLVVTPIAIGLARVSLIA
jgi:hypothetical protein